MDRDAIGAVGETLGAVGVITSLFYLASQIRRSAKVDTAAAYRQILDSWHLATEKFARTRAFGFQR